MYFHKDKMSMQVWPFLQIKENGTNTCIGTSEVNNSIGIGLS